VVFFPPVSKLHFLNYAHGKQHRMPPLHIPVQLFRFPLQCTLPIPPFNPLTIVMHTNVGNDKHVRYFNRDKYFRAADTAYRGMKRSTIAGSKCGTSSSIIHTLHWNYYCEIILVFLFLCFHVTCQLLTRQPSWGQFMQIISYHNQHRRHLHYHHYYYYYYYYSI